MFGYIKFWFQAGAIIAVTVVDSILVLLFSLFLPGRYNYYRHYKRWSRRILWCGGVKVDISGSENIKPGETYIYITNHSSLFDIPVIFSAIDDNIRIMYKKELENIPVFGWGLKVSPFIAVSRSKAREAMGSIDIALAAIRENMSVILFPEGTRSKDGRLGQFKRGAFMLASRSGKPILPVTIVGSSQILPKHSYRFNRKNIKVIIHPPFYHDEQPSRTEEQQLMQQVHDVIEKALDEND